MKSKTNPAVIEAQEMAATMHQGGSYKVKAGKPVLTKPTKAASTTATTTATKKEK